MTVPSVPDSSIPPVSPPRSSQAPAGPDSAPELAPIAAEVRRLAQQSQQDIEATLALLRLLEALHREIRTTSFQRLLPTNRQALYALLREIEGAGGWPYIPRMTLRSFLQSLPDARPPAEPPRDGESALD